MTRKLSIIVPVYNEKATIKEVIFRLEAAVLPGIGEKEIVLVDDFSDDGTRDIIKEFSGRHVVEYHPKNMGKGASVRTGFKKATGDFVIIQDGDLEYDPGDLNILLGPLVSGAADVVYGSRFVGDYPHRVLYFWHYCANRFLTLLSNIFTNLNLTDIETGYKAFKREVLASLDLRENRFGFEPEVTAKVAKGKWRIYEVGISYSGRTYEEGKKINFSDGLKAVWYIIKYNLF